MLITRNLLRMKLCELSFLVANNSKSSRTFEVHLNKHFHVVPKHNSRNLRYIEIYLPLVAFLKTF